MTLDVSAPAQYRYSVIIPTHNRSHLLSRALHSVLAQKRSDMEVIIVDDGSATSVKPIVDQVLKDNIKFIRHELPLGVSAARNAGIRSAAGDWIIFLDDDDEFSPEFFQNMHDCLTLDAFDPRIMYWSSVRNLHYSEASVETVDLKFDENLRQASAAKLHELVVQAATGYGFTLHRSAFADCSGFSLDFPVGEDTELFIRLLSQGIAPRFNSFLGVIKHNYGDSLSADLLRYSRSKVYEKILLKHDQFFIANKPLYFQILFWCVLVHVKVGEFKSANKALRFFLRRNYLSLKSIDYFVVYSFEKFRVQYVGLHGLFNVSLFIYKRAKRVFRKIKALFLSPAMG